MQQEFDALIKNNTWTLFHLPKDRKIIGYKWIFRIKKLIDNTLDKRKSRLIAKGYDETAGFNFSKNFSLVIKQVTIQIILIVVLSSKYQIHQLDINNAFLNGALQEEVFMIQIKVF